MPYRVKKNPYLLIIVLGDLILYGDGIINIEIGLGNPLITIIV